MLAAGCHGGRVTLVDAATGKVKWAAHAHSGQYSHARVAISPTGKFVASVDDSEHFMQWEAGSGVAWMAGAKHGGTGACRCSVTRSNRRSSPVEGCPLKAHSEGVNAVAFSPCGQRLATGGQEGAVILWDARTGTAEHVMRGHSKRVYSLSFSSDGAKIASGATDWRINVWDTKTGAVLRMLPHPHWFFDFFVQFAPTLTNLLLSTGFNEIHLWDVDTGEISRTFEGRRLAMFAPDGAAVVTVSTLTFSNLRVFDAATGTTRLILNPHP